MYNKAQSVKCTIEWVCRILQEDVFAAFPNGSTYSGIVSAPITALLCGINVTLTTIKVDTVFSVMDYVFEVRRSVSWPRLIKAIWECCLERSRIIGSHCTNDCHLQIADKFIRYFMFSHKIKNADACSAFFQSTQRTVVSDWMKNIQLFSPLFAAELDWEVGLIWCKNIFNHAASM